MKRGPQRKLNFDHELRRLTELFDHLRTSHRHSEHEALEVCLRALAGRLGFEVKQ